MTSWFDSWTGLSLRGCTVAVALFVVVTCAVAQPPAVPERAGAFVDHVHHDQQGDHGYVVFVPAADIPRPLPVVMFLHGAGEKGSDGRRQMLYGLGTALERFPDFPAYVVFPQCEDVGGRLLTGWLAGRPDARRALRILDEVIENYPIDAKRQSLCGWSMGAYGSWSLANADPQRWTAVLAVAGGSEALAVEQLRKASLPIWAVHGESDLVVPVTASVDVMAALNDGVDVPHGSLTLLPDIGHDSWRWAFGDRAALNWLIQPTALPPQLSGEPLPEISSPALAGPFRPDVILPEAVGVRLGNSALKVIAAGIPQAIPPESLVGKMNDIRQSIPFQGEDYIIEMTGLTYESKLSACEIEGISGERLKVRFWLNPLTIRFGGATLTGKKLIARTDGFSVVVGHRRPVAITLEVRPESVDSNLRFVVLRQQFEISDDNWYVTRPANIESFDEKFPPRYVETGLVGGLYQRRQDVEQQVLSVIPSLLLEVEQRLQSGDQQRFADKLWPLPVLAPASQILPGKIRTDRDGISVELALAAKFPDRGPSPSPLVLPVLGRSIRAVGTGEQLRVQVSWGIVGNLSGEYAKAGTAHVNVLDLPEPSFHELASPEFLNRILPGVDSSGMDVVLQLVAPLELAPLPAERPGAQTILLRTSDVWIRYLRHADDGSAIEVASCSLTVEQPLEVSWTASDQGLAGKVTWTQGVSVGCNSMEDANKLIRETFEKAWNNWTRSLPETRLDVPPIEIGPKKLFPRHLELRPEFAELVFEP